MAILLRLAFPRPDSVVYQTYKDAVEVFFDVVFVFTLRQLRPPEAPMTNAC